MNKRIEISKILLIITSSTIIGMLYLMFTNMDQFLIFASQFFF